MEANWEKLSDLNLEGIFGKGAGSARCWLSPFMSVEEAWLGRANRTRWMHGAAAAESESESEIKGVLQGPGVYLWVLPLPNSGGKYRLFHVGRTTVNIEERQKVHLRHACNGTDHLWLPDDTALATGPLRRTGGKQSDGQVVRPSLDQLKRHLSSVRILCISLCDAHCDIKRTASDLEGAIIQAAATYFQEKNAGVDHSDVDHSDGGCPYVSNSSGKAAKVDATDPIQVRDRLNSVIRVFE